MVPAASATLGLRLGVVARVHRGCVPPIVEVLRGRGAERPTESLWSLSAAAARAHAERDDSARSAGARRHRGAREEAS
jgi:hypothetical protein